MLESNFLYRDAPNENMVHKEGIEPSRLAAVDFESTASADFATCAFSTPWWT